jgi:hypothetical protein
LVERNFRVGILQSEIRLRLGFGEIITFFGCNSHTTRGDPAILGPPFELWAQK